jgi:hypothetical protein
VTVCHERGRRVRDDYQILNVSGRTSGVVKAGTVAGAGWL